MAHLADCLSGMGCDAEDTSRRSLAIHVGSPPRATHGFHLRLSAHLRMLNRNKQGDPEVWD